jgi:folate-binding protein YgfZ
MTAAPTRSHTDMALADTLASHAVLRERPDLGVVRVTGEDRVTWLNGQVTNDVREIAPGASVHALSVNVRGKILSELWVTPGDRAESLWLIAPRTALASMLGSFEHFIIMEDVTLEPLDELGVLSLEGPASGALQAAITLPEGVTSFAFAPLGLGGRAWIGTEAGLQSVGAQLDVPAITPEAYELARLRRARPRFGIDFDEHQYPQEAGLKDSVSFNKGCYLGQEVVCTLESRGRLSRHLCALRGEDGAAVESGANLSVDGQTAIGTITSAVWDPQLGSSRALAYIKRTHAHVGAVVLAGTQRMTIESLVGEPRAAS